jgi:hypothetical protein
MKNRIVGFRSNAKLARAAWGEPSKIALQNLKQLTSLHSLSVAAGDLQFLGGKWYVTHSGLLGIARRNRCCGIKSDLVERHSDPAAARWVFKATVYDSRRSRGFVGYGDADPSNVSTLMRGAEMRVAETRAVNRALRKAYGIGLCSVDELGLLSSTLKSPPNPAQPTAPLVGGSSNDGHRPRLRDQLCLLIRQHSLEPTLVKAYAADFCGTQTLKHASRDLVESFISHLAEAANEDRDGLVCKLNSYARPAEAKP